MTNMKAAWFNYLIAWGKAVKQRKADAVLVEGKEIHSGENMKIFYFGRRRNYSWLLHAFGSGFEVKETFTGVPSLDAFEWVERYGKRADIAVLDLGYVYSRWVKRRGRGYLCIPDSVGQKLEIGGDREELTGSSGDATSSIT